MTMEILSSLSFKRFSVFFFSIFFSACLFSQEESYKSLVDYESIEKVDKNGLLSADSAFAVNVALQDFVKNGPQYDIEDYLIKIEREDVLYKVLFIVPRKEAVLGGGAVEYKISKKEMKIISKNLIK